MKPGTLRNSEALRTHYLSFITETLQYLSVNEFIWDNLQILRYHFCIIVRCVAQELQFTEFLDNSLRKDLFHLLHKWSRGEELLKEEQNRKKLVTCLAPSQLEHSLGAHQRTRKPREL